MKLKQLLATTLLLVGVSSAICSTHALAERYPVTTKVYFGSPGSAICSGKGICNTTDPNAVDVTFTYVNHNCIVMSFNLNALTNYQPDQAAYFQNASYMFDVHYSLYNDLFAQWNLGIGAWINTSSSSSISIVNGIVYDTIGLEYYY
jgi:hypothetical protein